MASRVNRRLTDVVPRYTEDRVAYTLRRNRGQRASALGHICPNTCYYRSRARNVSALRMRTREIAQARPRFGYVRIWIMLRSVAALPGHVSNFVRGAGC